jgi:anti-sigma B factor antagonist
MKIEAMTRGEVLVVKLYESRLDSYVATEFRDEMDRYAKEDHTQIVLDLSAVDFVDSSGLGAIVTTQKRLGRERDLIICGANDPVTRLFKLARLDKIFRIVRDENEALSALSS